MPAPRMRGKRGLDAPEMGLAPAAQVIQVGGMSDSRWCALMAGMLAMALGGLAQTNAMRPAAEPRAPNHFARIDALDIKAIVPAPPAAGSIGAQAEIETLLQVQAWRSAEEVAWAKLIDADNVFNHAAILGSWFTPQRLPFTAVFFKQLGEDLRALDALAKKPFLRPRPSAVEPRIQPCVNLPASTSYPSATAMQALVWAELLAEALPGKRAELLARAERAGWARVIGGVHYPSDLIAGRLLARAYLAEARKNAAFREAYARCRQEIVVANPGR